MIVFCCRPQRRNWFPTNADGVGWRDTIGQIAPTPYRRVWSKGFLELNGYAA